MTEPGQTPTASHGKSGAQRALPLADLLLMPLMLLVAPLLRLVARIGWRATRCQAVLDRAGLAIVRHHYYTPVVLPADLDRPLTDARTLSAIDMREEEQTALLRQFRFGHEFATALPDFDFANPNFARDDAYVLYGLLRLLQPRRMIEIGSGYSTLVAAAALARNERPCHHLCVEPFEMPWLESTGVEVRRERVEQVDPALFDMLEAGDVLFIDSTHVIRPQGDVVREYLEILPRLRPGVIVHIHDVYTPHDIHPYLVIEQRKLWDEQYLMEALLSGGDKFEVLLAVYFICRRQPEAFACAVPGFTLPPPRDSCSFYLRVAEPSAAGGAAH